MLVIKIGTIEKHFNILLELKIYWQDNKLKTIFDSTEMKYMCVTHDLVHICIESNRARELTWYSSKNFEQYIKK